MVHVWFLLKEWYKQSDNRAHRQEAMQRLAKSLDLQSAQGRPADWLPQARRALGYLGDDCYDDAVAAVNTFQTGDEANVLALLDQYASAVQALKPGTDLSAERAAFHKNMAHAHATLYAATSDEVHFEGIQANYREALVLTPDDPTAWYNLAVHLYNRGVGVMKELGLETSLGEIIEKQQASRGHFSEALPAFESALELQPDRLKSFLGWPRCTTPCTTKRNATGTTPPGKRPRPMKWRWNIAWRMGTGFGVFILAVAILLVVTRMNLSRAAPWAKKSTRCCAKFGRPRAVGPNLGRQPRLHQPLADPPEPRGR